MKLEYEIEFKKVNVKLNGNYIGFIGEYSGYHIFTWDRKYNPLRVIPLLEDYEQSKLQLEEYFKMSKSIFN